ncbi:MAG: galactose 1-dehydrogenase [Robiginitomaculum sp.]|nr:MAG: galactose 1-dehydrogenase [Robiginitomaculum sp.]
MNTALVSIGKIARDQHIPAIENSPDFTLTAAVSRNAKVEGAQNFVDIETMLSAQPDTQLVSLCMPPAVRFDYAAKAIAAGRHVMLEKPPGATLSECHELIRMAEAKGVSLFVTWHSRYAAAVADAKEWLAGKQITGVEITWKEDVRLWHPGQDWIWQAGGMGVFDPGINALSVLTEIMPNAVFVKSAVLEFPANCDTPIAAQVAFHNPGGGPVNMVLDWLQEGPQTWDIAVETAQGAMLLQHGGAKLSIDGVLQSEAPDREYAGLYARMAALIEAGASDTDLTPMTHVADAFAIGRRKEVEAFYF